MYKYYPLNLFKSHDFTVVEVHFIFKFCVTGMISYWLLAEIVPCFVKDYIGTIYDSS